MMIVGATLLCVTLSLLLTINATSVHDHQFQTFQELGNAYQLDHSALPRKLMLNNKVEDCEAKDLASSKEQNKHNSGKSQKGEVKVVVHAAKGTRQEWIEGSDPNHEFFTMDYSHVRRRRPIHNKSFPMTVTKSP